MKHKLSKIAFYINTIGFGGAERVIVNLAGFFATMGYEVLLITSFSLPNEYSVDERVRRITLENNESNNNFFVKNFRRTIRLRRVLKQEKTQVLISFMAEPNFRSIMATRGLNVKNIISVRNDPKREYAKPIFNLVQKILYPFANGIVFQTSEARAWFPERIQKKSAIIMNQVDERFFSVNHINEDYYVAIGRLNKQKNYPLLIHSFARFSKEFPSEVLRIYGIGNEEKHVQDLIQKEKMEKHIFLMGKSDDIPAVLARAKAFILSSDYEGIPNSLLEAMAAGIPCIATNCPCGGPKAIIDSGKNGILIPVGNEEALYKALYRIHTNIKIRQYFSTKAKERAKEFTPEKVFASWNEYVSKVFGDL